MGSGALCIGGPKVAEIVCAALSGRYYFHGSPKGIRGPLKPSPTIRGGPDNITYQGTSLHATPVLHMALAYLADRNALREGVSFGVNLFDADGLIRVRGGRGIVRALYGRGGWLYALPRGPCFVNFHGLATHEVASFSPVEPSKRWRLSFDEWRALISAIGARVQVMPPKTWNRQAGSAGGAAQISPGCFKKAGCRARATSSARPSSSPS